MLPFNTSELALNQKYSMDEKDDLFDKYHDSAFDEKVVEINGCSIISDGMDGNYNFFGKIFKKSKNYEHIQTTKMPKVSSKVKKNVEGEIIKVFGTTLNVKPDFYLLTHYR